LIQFIHKFIGQLIAAESINDPRQAICNRIAVFIHRS